MRLHRPSRKTDSEARILPLINVVFLLLIFFMLAGRLEQADLFEVAPPVSGKAAEAAPGDLQAPREIVLLLAADGRLALDGAVMTPQALTAEVAARLAAQPDLPLVLKADGGAEALRVVEIMESLRAAGLRDLQLLARPPGGRP